jgi:hypothetical protein
MKVQDLAIEMTERANTAFLRAARAMPEDKLAWSPEGARSTLDLLQEVAGSAMWPVMLGLAETVPIFDPGQMQQAAEVRKALDTVDKCAAELESNTQKLREFLGSFPDERLAEKMALPFGPDMVMTRAEILFTHYWNATYHTGQICYLQTMLGDREMH